MTAHTTPRPMIETWYKTGQGDMFEVVAVDEDAIGIQYLDGSVEELDEDAWTSLGLEIIDPPRQALAEGYDDDEAGEGFEDEEESGDGRSHEWGGAFDDYE